MGLEPPELADVSSAIRRVSEEITVALSALDAAVCQEAARLIVSAKRLYFTGAGRSGIGMGMIAMRFMHLGFDAHMIGEPTAPAVGPGDLVVVPSGSGTTESVLSLARRVKSAGAQIVALTTNKESPLAALADLSIIIAAAGKQNSDVARSTQYAGSLFEQAAILTSESLFHSIWQANKIATNVLWARHANWE